MDRLEFIKGMLGLPLLPLVLNGEKVEKEPVVVKTSKEPSTLTIKPLRGYPIYGDTLIRGTEE